MRVRWWLPWLAVGALILAALVVASRSDEGERSQAARVERIAAELRCPTCQGLSVADSPASTARAIRDDVARRVAEGQGDDEIKQAYVDRYGDWILLRPKASGLSALVWVLPVAALLAAGAGFGFAFRRSRREPSLSATQADREVVERALAERDLRR